MKRLTRHRSSPDIAVEWILALRQNVLKFNEEEEGFAAYGMEPRLNGQSTSVRV